MLKTPRYSVYEASPCGAFRVAAEIEASCDREALHEARKLLPHGHGELRERGRVVCRFGRSTAFMLPG